MSIKRLHQAIVSVTQLACVRFVSATLASQAHVLLIVVLLALVAVGSGCVGQDNPSPAWQVLEPGLDIAHFDSQTQTQAQAARGDFTVLRVDPKRWALRVISGGKGSNRARTMERWCDDFQLVAAINAGMYQEDGLTHVGYCQVDGQVINPAVNKYQSAVALDPLFSSDPLFRIFDLDETKLADIVTKYHTVVQNLRLIKRPMDSRWSQGSGSWPEAALGEDEVGRALLIYCTRPMSMYDFNQLLLKLPLHLVCAQHLEGNSAAKLWVQPAVGKTHARSQFTPGKALPLVLGVSAGSEAVNAPRSHAR